jgi:hypothetical protein
MNKVNFDITKTIRAEPGESFNENIINNLNLFVK